MDSSNLTRYKLRFFSVIISFSLYICANAILMCVAAFVSCERMAIEYIWLFLEESTTSRRERGRNCTKTIYNKSTAIFAAYFSEIFMAPSYGMAIFGRGRCCQVKLAGKFIVLFKLSIIQSCFLPKVSVFVRIIMIL